MRILARRGRVVDPASGRARIRDPVGRPQGIVGKSVRIAVMSIIAGNEATR